MAVKILSVRLSDTKAVIEWDQVDKWADLNRQVIGWFKDHPEIKISHLCSDAGISQGSMSMSLSKGQIKEEALEKIIPVIEKLGFIYSQKQ